MKDRLLRSSVIMIVFSLLPCASTFGGGQKQSSGTAVGLALPKERKVIERVEPGPRRRRVRVPATLLTIEYKVVKSDDDGNPVETSPTTIFQTGDRYQLRIKTNQEGYLHIIAQTDGHDGEIIFPDSRINNGNNFIRAEKEFTVPSNCGPDQIEKRTGLCWLWMQPPAGKEIFTIIFSREAIPDSIERINKSGVTVSQSEINRMVASSDQKLNRTSRPRGVGAEHYRIWITNRNVKNNEELIAQIVLNHADSGRSRRK
jgi:hypothetical protein